MGGPRWHEELGDRWLKELKDFVREVGGQWKAAEILGISRGVIAAWSAGIRKPASSLVVDGLRARLAKARARLERTRQGPGGKAKP